MTELQAQIRAIAKELAKREGKKSQARIGDIRELLGIMGDVFHETPMVAQQIADYGLERAAKRPKKPRAKKAPAKK